MKLPFVRLLINCSIIISLNLFPSNSFSQSLLLNGNFEEENICTEYKVNCAPEAWFTNDDVFNNYFKDADRAYEGYHCMSLEAGHVKKYYKRTFIRSQLLCRLKKENKYRIEFYIKSSYPILDSIGVLFSVDDFLFDRRPLQAVKPSFFISEVNKQIKKDSSWQKVSFDYTAKGGESFITIGNFSKRDITGDAGRTIDPHFFVFIDAVSLVPLTANESLCDDWQSTMADIYDQDERHEFLRRKIIANRRHEPVPGVREARKVAWIDTLVLQEVLFETGKAELQRESYLLLDSFCSRVTGGKIDSVVVEGHTDSRGTEEMNSRLSSARVQTVLNYFASRTFVKPNRIFARSWGELKPVADNHTSKGRQRNRRVVVFVYISG
jgi:outer membrane protein OmpA-like peptidoglycan-associated protein